MMKSNYPFTAIVGQEDFKLALILNLIDPLIGGVLAIGDKGTGKTTLIRSLSDLMKPDFPFVNLPIGATEDRLLGAIDLEKLINDKQEVVKLGLLAQANQGVLYVDEINLLEDYLTDVLLDAAVSGGYHLEREGISRYLDSRFCLVGSMNPEEGDLRPQLKDRFGFCVFVNTPSEVEIRKQIIKNRIAFEDDPTFFVQGFLEQEGTLVNQINTAKSKLKSVSADDQVITKCAELALEYQVEGLRADVLLLRASRAYAAYLGQLSVAVEHIEKVLPFVMNHRSDKKSSPDNKQEENQSSDNKEGNDNQEPQNGVDYLAPILPQNDFKKVTQNEVKAKSKIGNLYKSDEQQVDVRKSVGQYLATDKFELKSKRSKQSVEEHYVFLIDSSGSMLTDKMVAYAKGAIAKITTQAQGSKIRYSILSLFDGEADVQLNDSSVLKDVNQALSTIKTGGKTNLIAGLKKIKQLTTNPSSNHHLTIITDGRFNEGGDLDDAVVVFKTYCKGLTTTRLIDAEQGLIRLGLVQTFANRIGGAYEKLMIDHE